MTEDQQDIVEVAGQVTRDDYMRFVTWTSFRLPLALRLMALIFVTVFVLGVVFLPERDATGLLVVLGFAVVAAVFMTVVIVWSSRSSAVKLYQTYKLLQQPIRYRFSRDAVSTTTPSSQGSVSWSAYYRLYETKQAFYLYLAASLANVIPKRFFESEEQMQKFRELLRANLPPEVCKI